MKRSILAALALSVFDAPATALEADVSRSTLATPERAWEAIGDFCGIAAWHPSVKTCELSEVMGAKLRRITLVDGGNIREQLVEQNAETRVVRSLFLDGTLPVSNYQATLKIVPTAQGSSYQWSGNFEANGVTDTEAVKSISEFYRAGIEALAEKSKK